MTLSKKLIFSLKNIEDEDSFLRERYYLRTGQGSFFNPLVL